MPSALELSAKHKISVAKVQAIAADLNVHLPPEEFAATPDYERAARDLYRSKRVSAFTLAFAAECWMDGSAEKMAQYSALVNYIRSDEFGQTLDKAIDSLNRAKIPGDLLSGAKGLIDKVSLNPPDAQSMDRLASWIKAVLRNAKRTVDHNYIAVRLLLSMPADARRDYPRPIVAVLNRLKHHGYLDGCWRLETVDGKGKTFYHPYQKPLDL